MFLHLYKYRVLKSVRNKSNVFWSIMFPIILGTMFHFALGNITKTTENLEIIPVAVVGQVTQSEQEGFDSFMDAVSSGDDQILSITNTTQEKAETLLEKEKVKGIVTIKQTEGSSTIEIQVKKTGMQQSILKAIFDSYAQMQDILTKTAQKNPQNMQAVIAALESDASWNKETTLGNGNMDSILQYFYALIGMACLYGCFMGSENASDIQANLSQLGARRSVTPTNKLFVTVTEYLAAATVHLGYILILLCYLIFVLGVDFGKQTPFIFLASMVGSMFGVAYGLFIGSVLKVDLGLKMAILVMSSMVMSYLGGLMQADVKIYLEKSAPIVNRLNPANLIGDMFYSLNVYDNYDKYFQNLITLLIMVVVLCVGSFFVVRRNKFASL